MTGQTSAVFSWFSTNKKGFPPRNLNVALQLQTGNDAEVKNAFTRFCNITGADY